MFTFSLYEFIDVHEIGKLGVEKVACELVGQVLPRGKKEDGSVTVFHLLGMLLGYWLNKRAKRNVYR